MFCIPAGPRQQDYCVHRPLCLSAGTHQTGPWVMLNTVWTANSRSWERLKPAQPVDSNQRSFIFMQTAIKRDKQRYNTSTQAWKWKSSLQYKSMQCLNSASCQGRAIVRKTSTAHKKFNFTCDSGSIRWLLACKLNKLIYRIRLVFLTRQFMS